MKRVLSSELQQYEKSPNPANRTIISTTTKQTLKSDAVQFENSVKVDNLQSNGRKLKGTVKPRKRECSDCGKLFANLEQHIKIVHKKIKNFECVNCKRRFYDNRELRNHEFQSLLAGQCRQSNRDGKYLFFNFKEMLQGKAKRSWSGLNIFSYSPPSPHIRGEEGGNRKKIKHATNT